MIDQMHLCKKSACFAVNKSVAMVILTMAMKSRKWHSSEYFLKWRGHTKFKHTFSFDSVNTWATFPSYMTFQFQRGEIQYIPRNMHTVFALLCFVVVIHWLIFPYPSGLLHWHCGNLTIAPVPAKQPWWIWINTSCEFIMNDCITTTKQSTTKPCAYFLGYTVQWLKNAAGTIDSHCPVYIYYCFTIMSFTRVALWSNPCQRLWFTFS